MATLTIELPAQEDQRSFNLRHWQSCSMNYAWLRLKAALKLIAMANYHESAPAPRRKLSVRIATF